jgi:hypothetical protein
LHTDAAQQEARRENIKENINLNPMHTEDIKQISEEVSSNENANELPPSG